MAKSYLGIDIGSDMLKLAYVKDGNVRKTVSVPMPVNLLREGRITSTDAMGELIEGALKENRMNAARAAATIPGDVCYLRNAQMPRMSAEQLTYNIPYEFSDYLTGEVKDYLFDYALIPDEEKKTPAGETAPAEGETAAEDAGGGEKLSLLISAVEVGVMEELRQSARKGGMKLAKAAPAECAYMALIRDYESRTGEKDGEYCFVDLGYRAIRMYMFHGPRHVATRALDVGLSSLTDIIADAKGVDAHLAHTYLLTNFEDCQKEDYCRAAYDNFSVELMRALNFYRFSNPDSQITKCWLCGGGAGILPLRELLSESLDVEVHTADELLRDASQLTDGFAFIQAIGIAMD